MKSTIKIFIICLMAMLIPGIAIAQADGGKKTNVTQTSSPKKKTIQNSSKKPKATTGTINGHEWVDLGLPSGTKWASKNVGAYKTTDLGDQFFWGETKITPSGSWTTVHYDEDIAGNKVYDVATKEYGDNWRTPNKMDYLELINECLSEWVEINDIRCLKFTGPNGMSILFPTVFHTFEYGTYDYAVYWSSIPIGTWDAIAFDIIFSTRDSKFEIKQIKKENRGFVRPVIK